MSLAYKTQKLLIKLTYIHFLKAGFDKVDIQFKLV